MQQYGRVDSSASDLSTEMVLLYSRVEVAASGPPIPAVCDYSYVYVHIRLIVVLFTYRPVYPQCMYLL